MATNRAIAWPLELLKRKMFPTYFSRHKKSIKKQIYHADGHFKERIQDTTTQKWTAGLLISMVMTHNSIPMILIKFLITVTLFPQTV